MHMDTSVVVMSTNAPRHMVYINVDMCINIVSVHSYVSIYGCICSYACAHMHTHISCTHVHLCQHSCVFQHVQVFTCTYANI